MPEDFRDVDPEVVAEDESGEVAQVLEAGQGEFDSLGAPEPETGPPTTLDIHNHPADLAAGRDHLAAAVAQFGLDPRAVQQWYGQATGARPAEAPGTVRSRWLSTRLRYLQLQVQGRYARPVDATGTGQVVVHYALTGSP